MEFASLLCSLLLGAHYDAHCVSGYAVRELCELDQSLQDCPLLDADVEVSAVTRSRGEFLSRGLLEKTEGNLN